MDCSDGTDELACAYLYNSYDTPEHLRAAAHKSVLPNPESPFNWTFCAQSADSYCYPTHMRCIYSRILDDIPLCPQLEHLILHSIRCPDKFKVSVKDSICLARK